MFKRYELVPTLHPVDLDLLLAPSLSVPLPGRFGKALFMIKNVKT